MAWIVYVVWKALVNSLQLRWQLGNLKDVGFGNCVGSWEVAVAS